MLEDYYTINAIYLKLKRRIVLSMPFHRLSKGFLLFAEVGRQNVVHICEEIVQ